jgi:hypothetical protein
MADSVDTRTTRRRGRGRGASPEAYAVVASLLVHIVLFAGLRLASMSAAPAADDVVAPQDRPMELRFIAVSVQTTSPGKTAPASATASHLGETPAAHHASLQRDHNGRRPAAPALSTDTPAAAEGPATALNGEPSGPVPSPPAPPGGAASFTPPGLAGTPGVMDHPSTVTYKRTRFEDAWAPRDESAVAGGLRHLRDATTATGTVDLGHGVRMHCAIGLLAGGCAFGDPPSKAAAKDGDARLSLPPSSPLARSANDPPSPNEAECIRAYRKDERVLPGCATDTPLKAMDEETAASHHPGT